MFVYLASEEQALAMVGSITGCGLTSMALIALRENGSAMGGRMKKKGGGESRSASNSKGMVRDQMVMEECRGRGKKRFEGWKVELGMLGRGWLGIGCLWRRVMIEGKRGGKMGWGW